MVHNFYDNPVSYLRQPGIVSLSREYGSGYIGCTVGAHVLETMGYLSARNSSQISLGDMHAHSPSRARDNKNSPSLPPRRYPGPSSSAADSLPTIPPEESPGDDAVASFYSMGKLRHSPAVEAVSAW